VLYIFFFFQAEDGIRDGHVTGVQTCALPICYGSRHSGLRTEPNAARLLGEDTRNRRTHLRNTGPEGQSGSKHRDYRWPGWRAGRSEERRVGKEWRSGWWTRE